MEVGPWPSVTLAHSKIPHSVSPQSPPSSTGSLYTQLVMVTHRQSHALHCTACLKSGHQVPGRCPMFVVLLSMKEIDFCTTFEVGCWVAALCQLMVLLGGS